MLTRFFPTDATPSISVMAQVTSKTSSSIEAPPVPGHMGAYVHPQAEMASRTGLLERLQTQIEYYFSEKNLQQDHYLLGFLNHPRRVGMVPLEVVCQFPRVRSLCESVAASNGYMADPYVVALALGPSQRLQVTRDGRWIILLTGRQELSSGPIKSMSFVRGHSNGSAITEVTAPISESGSCSTCSLSAASLEVSEDVTTGEDGDLTSEATTETKIMDTFLIFSNVPPFQSKNDKLDLASEVCEIFEKVGLASEAKPTHIRHGGQTGIWLAIFAEASARDHALEILRAKEPTVIRGHEVSIGASIPLPTPTPIRARAHSCGAVLPVSPMHFPGVVNVEQKGTPVSPVTITPPVRPAAITRAVSFVPSMPMDGRQNNSTVLHYRPSDRHSGFWEESEFEDLIIIDDEDDEDQKDHEKATKQNRTKHSKKGSSQKKKNIRKKNPSHLNFRPQKSDKAIDHQIPPEVHNERHFPALSKPKV